MHLYVTLLHVYVFNQFSVLGVQVVIMGDMGKSAQVSNVWEEEWPYHVGLSKDSQCFTVLHTHACTIIQPQWGFTLPCRRSPWLQHKASSERNIKLCYALVLNMNVVLLIKVTDPFLPGSSSRTSSWKRSIINFLCCSIGTHLLYHLLPVRLSLLCHIQHSLLFGI